LIAISIITAILAEEDDAERGEGGRGSDRPGRRNCCGGGMRLSFALMLPRVGLLFRRPAYEIWPVCSSRTAPFQAGPKRGMAQVLAVFG